MLSYVKYTKPYAAVQDEQWLGSYVCWRTFRQRQGKKGGKKGGKSSKPGMEVLTVTRAGGGDGALNLTQAAEELKAVLQELEGGSAENSGKISGRGKRKGGRGAGKGKGKSKSKSRGSEVLLSLDLGLSSPTAAVDVGASPVGDDLPGFYRLCATVVECAVPASEAAQRPAAQQNTCQPGDQLTPAWEAGFKPGDEITSVAGVKTGNWDELSSVTLGPPFFH